jgi:hypothetical protein
MPKILRRLTVNEIASVDRGAGDGVKIVLMKRLPEENHKSGSEQILAYARKIADHVGFEPSDGTIAAATEKTTNPPRGMVVVNLKADEWIAGATTQGTATSLFAKHDLVLLDRDAVLATEFANPPPCAFLGITTKALSTLVSPNLDAKLAIGPNIAIAPRMEVGKGALDAADPASGCAYLVDAGTGAGALDLVSIPIFAEALIMKTANPSSPALVLAAIDSALHDREPYWKRDFSDKERQEAAASGEALPDGSFPIRNASDLQNAIDSFGRAKDPGKAKAHIIARARALGASDKIPDDWKSSRARKGLGAMLAKLLGLKKQDAIDFDDAQAAIEAGEYAQGMLTEICESVDALRQSVCSIMSDDELADKQSALEETFQQFKDYCQGIVPEEMEKALAAGLVAARTTAAATGAVTKGANDMTTETVEKAALDAVKKDLDAKTTELATAKAALATAEATAKAAGEAENKYRKRFNAVLKMSAAHSAFMNHPDNDMSGDEKKKFADMTPDERSAHIAKNPIEEATKKRMESLPEPVRKQLEQAAADSAALAKMRGDAEVETFTKRAVALNLPVDIAKHLAAVAKAAPEAWVEIDKALDTLAKTNTALVHQVETAGLFTEFGKSGDGATGNQTAMQKLQGKATELRKADPKLSEAEAFAKAYADNPDLVAEQRDEHLTKVLRVAA